MNGQPRRSMHPGAGGRWSPRPLRVCLAAALVLALGGCQEELSLFRSISSENIDGTPYLVLETAPILRAEEYPKGIFSIFKSTAADFGSWEEVVSNRAGPVLGTFAFRDLQGSRLGLLHPGRVSLFRLGDQPDQPEFMNLPFDWSAETGAQIGAVLYIFGAEFPIDPQTRTYSMTGKLKVARLAALQFEELNVGSAPELQRGKHGFWLKAVAHQNRIQLYWRQAQDAESPGLESMISLAGALSESTFDGEAFGGTVRKISSLPQGYTAVWSDGGRMRAVVQPQERAFGRSAPLRIFTLPSAGPPEEESMSIPQGPARLSFKFYGVERIAADGQEAFLRTNSQTFEVWRAGQEAWSVQSHLQGLPKNSFEQVLFGILGLSVGVVALGLGLAFRRRRQLQLVVSKLRPSDVLAPLSLRVSAHLIDLGLMAIAVEVLAWGLDLPSPGPLRNLFFDLNILGLYGAWYVSYLALTEWLAGATLGKLLLGLRVVSDKGEKPTLWAVLVRNLIGFFERHPVLAAFAALPTIFLTPRSQRLGDLLGRTLVVHKTAMDRFRLQRIEEREAAEAAREEDEERMQPLLELPREPESKRKP